VTKAADMRKPVILVRRAGDLAGHDHEYRIMTARAYAAQRGRHAIEGDTVVILCRLHRYASVAWHCSLLAEARGQVPIPSVDTILDLSSNAICHLVLPELDALLRQALCPGADVALASGAPASGERSGLDVFFGRVSDGRFRALARRAFDLFPCPILRLDIVEGTGGGAPRVTAIRHRSIRDLTATRRNEFRTALAAFLTETPSEQTIDIPEKHCPEVPDNGMTPNGTTPNGMTSNGTTPARSRGAPYLLAILRDPLEPPHARSARALDKFARAGKRLGLRVELIGKPDYHRIGHYDALFIREATRLNHHTYRFAKAAAVAGLPVIDDPRSIVRCTNKVFLAALLQANGVPTPQSLILDRARLVSVEQEIAYPIVLKSPDGSFSRDVHKADNRTDLMRIACRLFARSDLIVAQAFMPTPFDWRVTILDGKPIFVCQYFMVKNHWQVNKLLRGGRLWGGDCRTWSVADVPAEILRIATRAAALIGNGLYGVDLKETAAGIFVIEINDNPSIDAGVEDACLKDELYRIVLREFIRRIEVRIGSHGTTEENTATTPDWTEATRVASPGLVP
jgi:glutathione synthase/RimK-type ligase-like ATP-grasp enzyme